MKKQNKLPLVGVHEPEPVYNAKNQLVGHRVVLTYRMENFYSYPNDSEMERIKKTNLAAGVVRDFMSAGYTLQGDPRYVYYSRGLQVLARFTREHLFKRGLFANSYKRAQRFATKMREVVLHPGKYDGK